MGEFLLLNDDILSYKTFVILKCIFVDSKWTIVVHDPT